MLHSWKTTEGDEDIRNNNIRINWIGRIKIKGLGFFNGNDFKFFEKNKNISVHMVSILCISYICINI